MTAMKAAANRNLADAKRPKRTSSTPSSVTSSGSCGTTRQHFKGKVVYCNCDDPRVSNFFHYFSYNFEKLGLKKLITTCYKSQQRDLFSQNDSEQAIYLEYDGDKNGNGSRTPRRSASSRSRATATSAAPRASSCSSRPTSW